MICTFCTNEAVGKCVDVYVNPDEGFGVSIQWANAWFAAPTLEDTKAYLRRFANHLFANRPPIYHFGGWRNANAVEYDLSVIIADEAAALAFAIQHRQKSFYDFRRRCCMRSSLPGNPYRCPSAAASSRWHWVMP